MKQPVFKSEISLKGMRSITASSENKVWLDNKLLKFEKSLKVKCHTLAGFDWGNHEAGAAQLALAICLELYPRDLALRAYPAFKQAYILPIREDSFLLKMDLTAFNAKIAEPWMETS
ncbi:MAG: DUF6166 domain-containing protein [Desulfobacterales bacterium]